MTTEETILEILKYTIPALVVMLTCYSIVQRFLNTQLRQKQIEMLRENQEITVRLRLQAYERLALFVERSHPRNLIPRVYAQGMTVADLQQALFYSIKGEFEHNLSQQIYVTTGVWDLVRNVKEQEQNMINSIAQQLPPDAPAKDLHMRIVDYVVGTEGELPSEIALKAINEEARRILSFGALE